MSYLSRAVQEKRLPAPKVGSESIPPPIAGWNARDPLFGMDPRFAPVLDNFFPKTGSVELRQGYSSHGTGVGSGAVETVIGYFNGTDKDLLAAGGGQIYDATAAGVASSLKSGFTSNKWQGFNFGGRLFLFNGTDAPQDWDGTTMTATAWTGTGLTITNLIGGTAFKHRVHLIEKDTANIWIGAVDGITGATTKFDLSLVHPSGGNVIAAGSITIDGGAGPDDLICYFMDRGDVIVYSGTDPTAAFPTVAWTLVGIFKIGRVIGRRPLVKNGSDLIAITADGFVPVIQFFRGGRGKPQLAISDSISGAVNESVRQFGSNFGWQAVLYPQANWLLFNVPIVENGQTNQYVMNSRTGAWCRFTGMSAGCWEEFDDSLYFGSSGGVVYKADDGLSDDGANIVGDAQQAFVYFGGRGMLKKFNMFRPIVASEAELQLSVGFGVDFESDVQLFPASTAGIVGGDLWDVGDWDLATWSGGLKGNKNWQTAAVIGYAGSVRIMTETDDQAVQWFSTDVTFESGGQI